MIFEYINFDSIKDKQDQNPHLNHDILRLEDQIMIIDNG